MWSNEENGKKVASFPKTIYMCHKKIESIKEYSKNWKKILLPPLNIEFKNRKILLHTPENCILPVVLS